MTDEATLNAAVVQFDTAMGRMAIPEDIAVEARVMLRKRAESGSVSAHEAVKEATQYALRLNGDRPQRLDSPPPVAKKVHPPASNGALTGPVDRRDDVPPGEDLLREYEAGQADDPPLTYRDLAERYHCSTGLIDKRIKAARGGAPKMPRKASPTRVLTIEMDATKQVIAALLRIQEHCGDEAVARALATARLHLGLPRD